MRGGPTRRDGLRFAVAALGLAVSGCATSGPGGAGYVVGPRLHADDFRSGLSRWRAELERGGTVQAEDGVLDIDVPGGASLWFEAELRGPVMIEYEALAVAEGGPNDRVSDLNAFWMASDAGAAPGVLPRRRSGAFAEYDDLLTYYVGQGGNRNTTTRMRRYVGEAANRPILPQHDRTDAAALLRPNVWQTVRLVAAGSRIEYWADNERLFEMIDPRPYVRGWFAIRTTASHLRIRDFRVHALRLTSGA